MYLYLPDMPRSNKMTKRIRAPHDSRLAVGGTAVIYMKNIQFYKEICCGLGGASSCWRCEGP